MKQSYRYLVGLIALLFLTILTHATTSERTGNDYIMTDGGEAIFDYDPGHDTGVRGGGGASWTCAQGSWCDATFRVYGTAFVYSAEVDFSFPEEYYYTIVRSEFEMYIDDTTSIPEVPMSSNGWDGTLNLKGSSTSYSGYSSCVTTGEYLY